MVSYFMEDEIYFHGEKQPLRQTYIFDYDITPSKDGLVRVLAYSGHSYTLKPEQILEDNDMTREQLREVYGI